MERNPLADLMIACVPFGITPEDIRNMSTFDRAIIRFGRLRFEDNLFNLIKAAVNNAIVISFDGEKEG